MKNTKKKLSDAIKGMQVKNWEARENSDGKRVVYVRFIPKVPRGESDRKVRRATVWTELLLGLDTLRSCNAFSFKTSKNAYLGDATTMSLVAYSVSLTATILRVSHSQDSAPHPSLRCSSCDNLMLVLNGARNLES